MSKYIDTEKLKCEIMKLRSESCIGESDDYYEYAKSEIIDIIDSLEQEPRFPQYDNIVDKVFGAGNLESWEYKDAEMLVALAKEELLKSLEQEQPEVDIEKEIEEHAIYMPHGEFTSDNEREEDMEWAKEEFHHFYELGLNARK